MTRHLARMTWPQVADALTMRPVVLIPLGALEPHGPHMPMGLDFMLAEQLAEAAAARTAALIAPTLPHGYLPSSADFPGAVTLRAQTLIALLEDTFRSLIRHGVSHLLVVDNHRSNNPFVEAAARTVRAETGALVGSFFPWGTIINHAPSHYEDFAAVFGHGGEPESSTALGKAAAHLWINNSEISTTGTRGDPTVANAERGRKLVEAAVEDLVRVIEAFKKIPAEVKR